jgi:ubiquinone/menaquinone biosynthesis C-methylase UbiE
MSDPCQKLVQRPAHVCHAQHSGWLTSSVRRLFNNPRRILRGLAGPGDTVVDLGCGPGFFTLFLAEMVGESGHVVAVDIQEEMLARLRVRAEKANLSSRIQPHLAGVDSIGLTGPADFALAFWMVHEVPDRDNFLREVAEIVRQGGRFLLVEPRAHVSKSAFADTLEAAKQAGFVPIAAPRVGLSRATVFERTPRRAV